MLPHQVGNRFPQKARDRLVEVYSKELEIPDHRLVGIGAPERSKKKREPGQPFSQKAKEHLAGLVLNKSVDIKQYGVDRYGKILGVIVLEGININLEMLKMGFAEVYRGKPLRGFDLAPIFAARKEAMEKKRGMWVQGDKYVSPREWRMGSGK